MNLRELDNKWVRITLVDGFVCEGEPRWNCAEYGEAELGPAEESLQFDDWVIFESEIVEAEVAEPTEPCQWFSRPQHTVVQPANLVESWQEARGEFRVALPAREVRDVGKGDILRLTGPEFPDDIDYPPVFRASVVDICRDGDTALFLVRDFMDVINEEYAKIYPLGEE